jgi:uncharacterized RDD family membrane protein YckC
MTPLDNAVAIETPEHIVFHYRLAGPARRAVAHLLDLFLCYGAVALVGLLLLAAGGDVDDFGAWMKTSVGVVLLLAFFAQWVYFAAWEAAAGATPGKMALGLRVVTSAGRPIDLTAATLRNLLRAADVLPVGYAVGVVTMALGARFQRIGDLVADTMVVAPDRAARARRLEIRPAPEPSELRSIPDVVRLDPDERAALDLFLRRRARLGPARELELAAMVAPVFMRRFGCLHASPSRLLALLYDRAAQSGRAESPPSSRAARSSHDGSEPWR